MKILDYDAELDKTVAIIEYWYNRHTRDWVVQLKTTEGYQVRAADYVYRKDQALSIVDEYAKKYPAAKIKKT